MPLHFLLYSKRKLQHAPGVFARHTRLFARFDRVQKRLQLARQRLALEADRRRGDPGALSLAELIDELIATDFSRLEGRSRVH